MAKHGKAKLIDTVGKQLPNVGEADQRSGPAKRGKQQTLALGEYILRESKQNVQIIGARRELIRAVQRVLPRFARQLREQVYPRYAQLIEKTKGSSGEGTWSPQPLVAEILPSLPSLLAWAEMFHAAGEMWILEGALRTLSLWQHDSELRESLDLRVFQSAVAVDTLSDLEEYPFQFEYPGWDPQCQAWPRFRQSIQKAFEEQLQSYEERLRNLMTSQGAVRARRVYSSDNFDWFALYQFAGMSSGRILKRCEDVNGDESTILKGIKIAADLVQWQTFRRSRKSIPSG